MKSWPIYLAVVLAFQCGFSLMAQEHPSLLYGTVISVDAKAGTILIAPKDGPQVTVATDASTKVQVSGKDAVVADIKPDMILRVSPATGTAVDLRAFHAPQSAPPNPATSPTSTPKPSLLYGTVISVDATSGTVVIAPKDGPQVTVTTDANTKVQVGGKDATLADIKPDMILRVSPASGTAVDLRAFTQQAHK